MPSWPDNHAVDFTAHHWRLRDFTDDVVASAMDRFFIAVDEMYTSVIISSSAVKRNVLLQATFPDHLRMARFRSGIYSGTIPANLPSLEITFTTNYWLQPPPEGRQAIHLFRPVSTTSTL